MPCSLRPLGLGALLLALAAPSFAGTYGDRAFAHLDRNHDGFIDSEDVAPMRERMFKRLDRDGDGFLSAAETTAPQGSHPAPNALPWRDRDGDGRISRAELMEEEPAVIVRGDSDGDKRLSRSEFDRLINTRVGKS